MKKIIQFNVDLKEKEKFDLICKEKHINKSDWFRGKISEFIASNGEKYGKK